MDVAQKVLRYPWASWMCGLDGSAGWMGGLAGWVDGWIDGWMDGWMDEVVTIDRILTIATTLQMHVMCLLLC